MIDWNSQPFGEITDGEISRRLGCSRAAVRKQREKRGVTACPRRASDAPRCVACGKRMPWSDALLTTCQHCLQAARAKAEADRVEAQRLAEEKLDHTSPRRVCTDPYHKGRRSLPLTPRYFSINGRNKAGAPIFRRACKVCDSRRHRLLYAKNGRKRGKKESSPNPDLGVDTS